MVETQPYNGDVKVEKFRGRESGAGAGVGGSSWGEEISSGGSHGFWVEALVGGAGVVG